MNKPLHQRPRNWEADPINTMVLNNALKRAIAQLTGAATRDVERPTRSTQRPDGLVIWVHVSDRKLLKLFQPVYDELTEAFPDLWFLVDDAFAGDFGATDNLLPLTTSKVQRRSTLEVVTEWQPNLILFLSDLADVEIAKTAALHQIETVYVPFEAPKTDFTQGRKDIAMLRDIMTQVSQICTQYPDQNDAWLNSGATPDQITEIGKLVPLRDPPVCDDTDLAAVLSALAGRPIWFASNLSEMEMSLAIAAHQKLLRKSHRLLLVLSPNDDTLMKTAEEMLTISDVSFGLRSKNKTPHMDTKAFIADLPKEDGLWHRASPISYLGGTTKTGQLAPHPFDSVALGSVVLHGDKNDPFETEFNELSAAGASIEVTTEAQLVEAVQGLLSPDAAARHAHAGWELVSAGAVAIENLVAVLAARLKQQASK